MKPKGYTLKSKKEAQGRIQESTKWEASVVSSCGVSTVLLFHHQYVTVCMEYCQPS